MNDMEIVRRYLNTFRQALKKLPALERDDAVREIESHIEAVQAEGKSATSVVAQLGDARTLARAYLVDQPDPAPAFWHEILQAGFFVGSGWVRQLDRYS